MKMRHPDIDGYAEVANATAFDQVWGPRGWELVTPELEFASRELSRDVTDLDSLTPNELRTLVRSRGLEPHGSKKNDLRAQLEVAVSVPDVVLNPPVDPALAADADTAPKES